jgi:hypothetical protein
MRYMSSPWIAGCLVWLGGGLGIAATKPLITQAPASQTVNVPDAATFTAVASGTPAPAYRWQVSLNGGVSWSNVSSGTGGTTNTFTTPATTLAFQGRKYRMVAANSAGRTVSTAATLTVKAAPVITSQPANKTVTAPVKASFGVKATGNPAPTYQWQVSTDGGSSWANVTTGTSGTTATYTTASTALSDHGKRYRVVVTNELASLTSNPATLAVKVLPHIISQPTDQLVSAGNTATFMVAATGNPVPTYQWQVSIDGGTNWANVASGTGANTAAYTTAMTTSVYQGQKYRVLVSNVVGRVASAAATLRLKVAPTITTQPASRTILSPATATFTVVANGRPAPTYQWQVLNGGSWVDVSGGTSASYTTAATNVSDNGKQYRVVVANEKGSVTSSVVTLKVNTAPTITSAPQDIAVPEGQKATFTVVASGTTPLTYQWKRNGTNITGATSYSYATPATKKADSGATFSVTVSNAYGSASSGGATLTVNDPLPSISFSANPASISAGQSSTLSWTLTHADSASIDGIGVITVPAGNLSVSPTTATTYTLTATGSGGMTTATATVTVADGGNLGDVPAWIASMPTLSNGLKWMPGVPGGIPAGTNDTALTPGQMTVSGINSAISAASDRGSPNDLRVVNLPAGTYSLSGTIVPQNYVILRGAGAWGGGRTRLNFDADGGIKPPNIDWGSVPITNMSLSAGGSLPAGSTTVPVVSTAGFAVGDLIQLDQKDDLSYVWLYDAGYEKRAPFTDGPYHGPISPGVNGFRSVGSVHVVTAVDAGLKTIAFDPPTRMDYTYFSKSNGTTQLQPQVWRVSRRDTDGLWYFGLESLSMAGPQEGAIVLHAGAYNFIKDVETDGSANGGISNDHVCWEHQFRSEIRRLYAHHTHGGQYSGGANYGINLNAYTSECLVIDSIAMIMNKPMQTNCAGPGNVFAYNYVDDTSANGGDWMDGAINGSHQSFTHFLLVEGNLSANIGCDTTHGNSGYMAFLRNCSLGQSTHIPNGANVRAANTDAFQREMAFIGNVLMTSAGGSYEMTGAVGGHGIWSIGQNGDGGSGDAYDGQRTYPWSNNMNYSGTLWDGRTPTFTTKAADKLFRHGNWDSVHSSIFDWNAGFPGHHIASSYFLTSAPNFFGAHDWPWIDPTGTSAGDRVKTLPAKARFDAGTPFAP